MKTFLQPLQNLAEMEEIRDKARHNTGVLAVSGCMESQKAHMVYGLSGLFPSHLIISEDERSAKQIFEDYRFYEKNVYYYPARDLLFFQADIHGNLLIRQRMQVIRALLNEEYHGCHQCGRMYGFSCTLRRDQKTDPLFPQ